MSLRWRGVRRGDLEACLALDPRSRGDGIVGYGPAMHIWQAMLGEPAFNAAVIELHRPPPLPPRIVSFGASVFLQSDYLERELAWPQPDLNSRIFDRLARERSPLRSARSLASQRDGDMLDLLLVCSSFDMAPLSQGLQEEVALMLPRSLVHLHAGYRIQRIVMETTQQWMRVLASSSGLWKLVAHFPAQERAYLVVTREAAVKAASFTSLALLFCHTAPRLGLRDAEKQLLCQAMHGATDTELAAELGLSLSSVKKRWSTLFARIATCAPKLLPEDAPVWTGAGRGPQKRHRILSHVREHPEEIRPFRWYPGS